MKRLEAISPNDLMLNAAVYILNTAPLEPDGWARRHQERNFATMSRIADYAGYPLRGASILDVGCGTGALASYARKHWGVADYVGVDISERQAELARKNSPGEKFVVADIVAGEWFRKYDYVFSSGALSGKLVDTDNYDFIGSIVEDMWNMANYGVAFNFLTDRNRPPSSFLFFYSPERVIELCREAAPDAAITMETSSLRHHRETSHQAHIFLYRPALPASTATEAAA